MLVPEDIFGEFLPDVGGLGEFQIAAKMVVVEWCFGYFFRDKISPPAW